MKNKSRARQREVRMGQKMETQAEGSEIPALKTTALCLPATDTGLPKRVPPPNPLADLSESGAAFPRPSAN